MPDTADTADTAAAVARRAGALRDAYAAIAAGPMAGLPVCNPLLGVEAIGFAAVLPAPEGTDKPMVTAEPPMALGVLLTPWCMNLVHLPLWPDAGAVPVGAVCTHVLAGQRLDFIGAHLPGVGGFSACSLFSPMADFVEMATARATAHAVLALLRPDRPVAAPTPPSAVPAPAATPARRAFLFGRGIAAAAGR